MADVSIIERWLIDLATMAPPRGRDEWANAMRGEFEALEGRRVGWALGCLSASLGWRLRANWALLLAFAVIVYWSDVIDWGLDIGVGLLMPAPAAKAIFYAITWGALAIESGVFAALRPRAWLSIGIGMALAQAIAGLFGFILYFHKPLSLIPHIHIMDAQIDVGIGAYLGYSLLGALIGRSLSGVFRRGRTKATPPGLVG